SRWSLRRPHSCRPPGVRRYVGQVWSACRSLLSLVLGVTGDRSFLPARRVGHDEDAPRGVGGEGLRAIIAVQHRGAPPQEIAVGAREVVPLRGRRALYPLVDEKHVSPADGL